MYQQLNKLKTIKNERFFKFKDHKIKSQDVLQICILLMLVIILYYVNLIKWTANEADLNTYERFISLEKPELSFESIINFQPDDRSSGAPSDAPFRNSNRQSPQSQLSSDADANLPPNQLNQPNSNRSNPNLSRPSPTSPNEGDSSFSAAIHEDLPKSETTSVTSTDNVTKNDATGNDVTSDVTSSVTSDIKSDSATDPVKSRLNGGTNRPTGQSGDNRRGDKFDDKQSAAVPNYQLDAAASETNGELNLNKLHLNPTKATSLQSSSNKLTDFNSILTADLSPNVEQVDRTSFRSSYYLESGVRGWSAGSGGKPRSSAIRLLDSEDSDQQEQKISSLHSIQVLSSKQKVELKIDNQIIFQSSSSPANRGIHIFVLNQHSLSLMSHRVFDTYSNALESQQLNDFLQNKVAKNRLLIFAVQDEAAYALSNETVDLMREIGCKLCLDLGWRDMYAMLTLNSFDSKLLIREQLSKNDHVKSWADAVQLDLQIDVADFRAFTSCRPPYEYLDEPDDARERRESFCSQIEGYADSICNCDHPTQIVIDTVPIPDNTLSDVPVAVIAANRPYYLHSMLNSLLSANGVNRSLISIYIDGYFREPYELGKLYGLRVVQHKPVGRANARISQHYYFSLNELFTSHPASDFAIIFEEDLIVSPDVFSYFSQTKHLLQEDPSIYCISAFNDNSYLHSSSDEALCYRVETMPGLGWMLSRKLWEKELKPKWPSPRHNWDWDLWLRDFRIRKGRECIIPDVSRTYHLGIKGSNMNYDFHKLYFENRALNQIDFVNLTDVDRLIELNYELHILDLVKRAHVINEKLDVAAINGDPKEKETGNELDPDADGLSVNSKLSRKSLIKLNKLKKPADRKDANTFCNQLHSYFEQLKGSNGSNSSSDSKDSSDRSSDPHVLYISMQHEQDFDSWLKCASCFSLWDLDGDPRGMHKGMWRFFLNDKHVLVIGSPASPYSVFKEQHIEPILINS